MTTDAVLAIDRSLDRSRRACEVVRRGNRSQADLKDMSRRLMDLDAAIFDAEKLPQTDEIKAAIRRGHEGMRGAA
ncbi:hypothetical protein [Aurantimonas endophytica]|uniref:Uncharacterized protein n=1 Tax=Aurantimonas endophytica TaxID=1522175 RepID=A0A7W6HDT7_9HYPH|nr:hypothetical protein [Aurantimonas endophytica]MBB4003232.1 hypothetical protein [Aurantimonas endophytica]MCO6404094.1 hypothetical protein [Aurantimonas endophytica]